MYSFSLVNPSDSRWTRRAGLREMLPIRATDWVLWLHVIAACIWIGGQVVVAVVIPLLRRVEGLTVAAGRQYQAVA